MLPKEDQEYIDQVLLESNNSRVYSTNRLGGEYEMITPIEDYGSYKMPASGSGMFLRIEDGENRIRILTKASEIKFHELGKGTEKYSTSLCTGKDCEQCKAGNLFKVKYAFVVLKRNADGTSSVHVYEAPKTVFKQIIAYDLNSEYGDVREYDLTIKKEGQKFDTVYTVIASPKKVKISDDEAKMILESGITLEKAYEAKA